jgi:hypothetical protein
MEYDTAKLEEAVLALLGAFEFENGRAWKRYDFAIMESLHKKGYITDPRGNRESVHLTEAGMGAAKGLAKSHFGQT